MNERIANLMQFRKNQNLDGVLIAKPENRRYFSGFAGDAGMLAVSEERHLLLTDFRFVEQAEKQAPGFTVIRHGADMYQSLHEAISPLGWRRIGFEGDFATWDDYAAMQSALSGLELIPVHLDTLRMVKDEEELSKLKTACEIADAAFQDILAFMKPGMTEARVALELEYRMRLHGSEKPAFDTIVASGPNGSLPHAVPSERVIQAGDFITMDFGAVYQGYHSDITRTVCAGKADAKHREIYELVLAAQLAGLAAVKPGLTGREVDKVSRDRIVAADCGEYFGHGLGHGVGLAIHEGPRLSPGGDVVLAPNMAVTVEPGVYLPGWGGVRIEDTVVVCAASGVPLTTSSKDLIELYWQ